MGGGPNGLAAAITLARAGIEVTVLEAAGHVGGGVRSEEAIVPGLVHDVCSAVHPMAVGSPFLDDAELRRHGLNGCYPISTVPTRSTTAPPARCTARSSKPRRDWGAMARAGDCCSVGRRGPSTS